MDTIKINVNRQIDGYAFSIAPSIRQLIKSWYPDFRPANNIFVAYDTKSDFELLYGEKLESCIYPVLLGIYNQRDLIEKVNEIQFVETQTGRVLHSHKVST